MTKKSFKDNLKGRRQSTNVEDRRPKKYQGKELKELMDFYNPHNKTLKSKDLKRAPVDDSTKLMNKINNKDRNRGLKLARYKSDTKPQKGFKK